MFGILDQGESYLFMPDSLEREVSYQQRELIMKITKFSNFIYKRNFPY